jgi:hypothetical protein
VLRRQNQNPESTGQQPDKSLRVAFVPVVIFLVPVIIEVRPKPKQEGLVGQPDEMETIFIPLINCAVDIVAAKKVELATEVPPALKKTSRVNKKK